MSHKQLPPPQQCHEWSDVDPDRRTLIFVQQFQSCADCGSPCVFVIVTWYATGLEPGTPLKHLLTTQDLVPEGLLNHCERLRSTFPKTGTNFYAHSLFLSLIHRENRQRSRTRLQIKTAQVHPATCNLVNWITIHGSPTIYLCFALPQLLYRWRHQSEIFWIPPRRRAFPAVCSWSTFHELEQWTAKQIRKEAPQSNNGLINDNRTGDDAR
jgi:hypothetical protein